jgi:hypothetical protein
MRIWVDAYKYAIRINNPRISPINYANNAVNEFKKQFDPMRNKPS